jgi:thymidylate synthase
VINEPVAYATESFQQAWLDAVRLLMNSHWELRNLVVQIRNPTSIDQGFHDRVEEFARQESLLGPKHVAYTIFPHGLYQKIGNCPQLFRAYNRSNGLYERLQRRKPSWGTYFRRMTHYEKSGTPVNQLGNIIEAIRTRRTVSKAAYTVVIQNPGGETVRPLGGPCLNYLAFQIEAEKSMVMGLLAVYRNHDFLERAYGNYWGLCNFLIFLANEVNAVVGPLTCVSSHAYVSQKRAALKAFAGSL